MILQLYTCLHLAFFLPWGGGGGGVGVEITEKILPNWRSQVFIRGSHDETERKNEVTNE